MKRSDREAFCIMITCLYIMQSTILLPRKSCITEISNSIVFLENNTGFKINLSMQDRKSVV